MSAPELPNTPSLPADAHTCQYTVSFDDFREAVTLWRRMRPARRQQWNFYYVTLPSVCLLWAIYAANRDAHAQDHSGGWLWATILPLSVACGLLVQNWRALRASYKARVSAVEGGVVRADFDRDGLRFSVGDKMNVAYRWSAFTHVCEGAKVTILCVGDASFHTLPRRMIAANEYAAMMQIVGSHPEIKPC